MFRVFPAGALVLSCLGPAWGATQERELTLEMASAEALAANPEIRAARWRVEEARGRLLGARTLPHNPELELQLADRRTPDAAATTDRGIVVQQTLEIAGQRRRRIGAAGENLAQFEAELERQRRLVLAETEIAFLQALAARELESVSRLDLELTRGLADFEERRLDAGAGTQLDLNLARAAAGRAEARLRATEAAGAAARARLGEILGAAPLEPPLPVGALPLRLDPPHSLEELARGAVERRADLEALRRAAAEAEQRLELEQRQAFPDLRLDVFARREEGDDIVGGGFSVALPIFQRNQGPRAEARAALSTSAATLRSGEQRALRELASSWARYRTAARALEALDALVVGTLEENLDLLEQSFRAGKVNASEVLVLRRELVEGRREQIVLASEGAIAAVELRLAIGRPAGTAPPNTPESEEDDR